MVPIGGAGARQQVYYLNTLVSQNSIPQASQSEPLPAAMQPNATPAQIAHQERIQRTVYCGNLAQGVITSDLLG